MSSRVTFGTIKRVGAILLAIAIVLAAGIVVFQAPAIFGVEEDSEASIAFEDQQSDGDSVVIDEVSLSDGGFVVVTSGGNEPIAVSDYLEPGTHENVTVESEAGTELVGQLTATAHRDANGDESFTYENEDGEADRPYLENGYPVSDTATVTTNESGETPSDSFTVESMTAPESATTNETIEVTARIANPINRTTQQPVELRLDGALLERQTLDLESGETREVSFEIDTSGTAPGNRTIGVYTSADGELEPINLTFHTEPDVTVVGASNDSVTTDVAIPAEGFVAVENATGTIVGASDTLAPGEHDNVTVEFDENASVADDEELTAALYEGDPNDRGNATVVRDDGERIETTFTLASASDSDASGNESDESDGNATSS